VNGIILVDRTILENLPKINRFSLHPIHLLTLHPLHPVHPLPLHLHALLVHPLDTAGNGNYRSVMPRNGRAVDVAVAVQGMPIAVAEDKGLVVGSFYCF
jgi:hypothetical protein